MIVECPDEKPASNRSIGVSSDSGAEWLVAQSASYGILSLRKEESFACCRTEQHYA